MNGLQGFSLSKVLQKVGSAINKHGTLIAAGASLIPGGAGVYDAARQLVGQGPVARPTAPPVAAAAGPGGVSTTQLLFGFLVGGLVLSAMFGRRRR